MTIRLAAFAAGCVAVLVPQFALAGEATPILRAHSKTVDIRDGDRLLKAIWTIDPTAELDVYDARRSISGKRVTFITDIDSMSFDTEPGRTYDFVIVHNDIDSCRSRISTMRHSARSSGAPGVPDSIPFTTRDGRIHVEARVNGSEPLDLMFDTGADITCLWPTALEKGAEPVWDGERLNRGFGGTTTRRISSDNRLDVAGLHWEHEGILYLGTESGSFADGILGYNVFEDKVVEIDYDQSVLIIHDSMPADRTGYAKFSLRFIGGVPNVELTFNTGRATDRGWFVIDTGATAALHLMADFSEAHGLYGVMERIGSSTSRGVGVAKVKNDIVRLPELAFGDFVIRDVPTHLETPSEEPSVSSGCLLGMDLLKRFNTILDYPQSAVYLKPSMHFDTPFKTRFAGPPRTAVLAIGAIVIALLAGLATLLAKRRQRARASAAT